MMRIIGVSLLDKFVSKHADARPWVRNWTADTKLSAWSNSHDVKKKYPTASFLANNIVIFNVKGNKYRLETQIAYQLGVVSINWIGTHVDYDKRTYK
jgi:mRNA interferase HigB